MPYFKTAQEWAEQSKLLLEARPSTTRITTRYSIKPAPQSKSAAEAADSSTDAQAAEPKPPRGVLVIKTYDPESGVVLKYRTTKAAEVSRLIQSSLGGLGRRMAALPDLPAADEVMTDALAAPVAAEGGDAKATSGGGKKKKKGKK